MRHHIVGKRLNRDMDHRKGLLKNLSEQLIEHEKIVTTEAKAKYLRSHFEKLITKAKKVNMATPIEKFNVLKGLRKNLTAETVIKKLVEELGPRFKDRNGGYTRITKVGNRDGDNASMSRIELVKDEAKAEKPVKATKPEIVEKTKKPAKIAKPKTTKKEVTHE